MSFLEVKNLVKEIEGNLIIDKISFKIEVNDFMAIVGKSGAGKSTILSLLSGMDYLSSGEILFEGQVLKDPRDQLVRGNKQIRLVKQDYDLYPYHRVYDILELPIRMLGDEEIEDRIDEMLSFFDLEEYRYSLPKELSGGMKQRLSIAYAMITYPKVLLLDEPFSHLDAYTSIECLSYIKKIAKKYNTTVVYVTHETEYALMFANKIMVVSDGEILQEGSAESVYKKPINLEVARLFGSAVIVDGQVIRPQNVEIGTKGGEGEVLNCFYLGDKYLVHFKNKGDDLIMAYSSKGLVVGEKIHFKIAFD